MPFEIIKNEDSLNLIYDVDYYYNQNIDWILEKFKKNKDINFSNTFFLKNDNLISYDKEEKSFATFKIASTEKINNIEYYKIPSDIFNVNYDLYIEKSCNISNDFFISERKTSIFKIINEIKVGKSLFIGGTEEDSISEEDYRKILTSLPNSYEHKLYDKSRICSTLKNYFDIKNDFNFDFNNYIENKKINRNYSFSKDFKEIDISRYQYILENLKEMLANENQYNENDWQKEIVKIIKIIYPKYVISVREAKILKGISKKDKHIDILLGDINGNVDIIEIKKPENIELLRKTPYRDNYIPSSALQGAVMQVEKYIFYLMKNGEKAEKSLDEQFKKERTKDYHFKITNPKAIIIMGHTDNMDSLQLEDLEIIKRKYTNILDIISYEELIHRLEVVITMLKN